MWNVNVGLEEKIALILSFSLGNLGTNTLRTTSLSIVTTMKLSVPSFNGTKGFIASGVFLISIIVLSF